MVIFDYYKSLDKKGKKKFRDFVLRETEISYGAFYTKMSGSTPWRKLEKTLIEEKIKEGVI